MGVRRYVDKDNGFFGIGGRSDVITEEEYTMDGGRHLQGGAMGKLSAENLECIKAEGAGESTGRMVGASVDHWSCSYVYWYSLYWLVDGSGWAVMLGQDTGAEIGGEIAKTYKDC